MLIRRDQVTDVAALLTTRIEGREKRSGPLPWLPPAPRAIADDDFWQRYFERRTELIETNTRAVRATATGWTEHTASDWATPDPARPRTDTRPGGLARSTRRPRHGHASRRRARGRIQERL